MPTKKELLLKYAQQVRRRDIAWDREYSKLLPPDEEFIESLRLLVDYDYPSERLLEIANDPVLQMQALLQDVLEDVQGFLPEHCRCKADQSIVGLLPRSEVNASCFGSQAGITDGYLIGLNSGLIHGTGLVSAALIADTHPSVEKPTGRDFFDASLRFFSKGSPEDFEKSIQLTIGLPPEVQVLVGANHSVMLWFVTLHECGHIVHGDVDNGRATSHAISHEKSTYHPPTWEEEYAADQFALESFLLNRPNAERAWTNYATVDLLYRWLDLATQRAKASQDYPPTNARLHRLRQWMCATWGDDPSNHLQTLDDLWHRWIKETEV
ncbi:ImmA/IrrE family metallo-endopeptidase [Aeoliella sp.]|uniref:ImmA/IrrE family metallo-endopeptidase n=1 Tax=Aeoliella sp. TaxID=2795800 RepID=UPI003CCB955A